MFLNCFVVFFIKWLCMKKILALAIIAVFAAALFGCTQSPPEANMGGNMMALDTNKNQQNSSGDTNSHVYSNLGQYRKVHAGDKVKVNYTGRLTDGNIFDSSIGKTPLEFTAGAGQMIKGFDDAVIGMKVGDTKNVTIPPEQAYGAYDQNKVVTVNASAFSAFTSVKLGNYVTDSYGNTGVIVKKNDQNVVIDFNHQLAGKTLVFEITLVAIE